MQQRQSWSGLTKPIAFIDIAMVENPRIDAWWSTMKEACLARNVGAVYQLMAEGRMADNRELMLLFKERVIGSATSAWSSEWRPRLAKRRAFIAVGAVHLPGERGILNLLVQQGYAITRIY